MARTYQTRFVNEVLTILDFQPGGITDRGRVIQARNAGASLLYHQELLSISDRLPLKVKVRSYANYIRHSLHQRIPISRQAAQVPSKALFWCCFPAGAWLRARDARLLNKK
jgi:ferredoxin-NADP reductase